VIRDGRVRQAQTLCAAGFAGPDLPAALISLIGEAVPFDLACWGLLDPLTRLPTTNFSTAPTGHETARIWEYELTVPDVITLRSLLDSAVPVGALSVATGGEVARSPRYRAFLGPWLDVTDELRAALVVNGIGWGWLSLMRRDGVPFSPSDLSRIRALVPHVAAALRSAVFANAFSTSVPENPVAPAPGVVILDADDRLDSVTPAGQQLIELLPSPPGLPIPEILRGLALLARAPSAGETVHARVPGRDGRWLYLEAAPLSGPGDRVAVTLQLAGRVEMSLMLCHAHGLTARESEVTQLVLRGESTRRIAELMRVSPWTVQDHLKAVFAKVGVRSRRDLTVRLFQAPAHRSGTIAGRV
jgi:DNA-binding CsgD family transcriptional regulator